MHWGAKNIIYYIYSPTQVTTMKSFIGMGILTLPQWWSSCMKHQSYEAGRVGGSYWHIAVWCVYETCVAHIKRTHLLAITSGGKHKTSWNLGVVSHYNSKYANSSLCISNTQKKGQLGISQRREQGEFRSEFRWLKAWRDVQLQLFDGSFHVKDVLPTHMKSVWKVMDIYGEFYLLPAVPWLDGYIIWLVNACDLPQIRTDLVVNNSPPTCRGEGPRPFAKASGCWNSRMIIPQMISWVWYFSKNFPNPNYMPKKAMVKKHERHLWKKMMSEQISATKISHLS